MLMIRFQRIGRTNDPAFRIVVLEKERAAKSGRINEQLGTYNPRTKAFTLNEAKIKEWISKGAQPTPTMNNFLITKGVIQGKKINVLPRKHPIKSEADIAAEAAAAKPKAEAAPADLPAEASAKEGEVKADVPAEAPVA